jgi:hypothetical protein
MSSAGWVEQWLVGAEVRLNGEVDGLLQRAPMLMVPSAPARACSELADHVAVDLGGRPDHSPAVMAYSGSLWWRGCDW